MSDPDENERWQVEVNEQVYDASFTELTEWIAEGSLLPEDKVRRGYLRWIQARKVPDLAPHFQTKAGGVPARTVASPVVSFTGKQPATVGEHVSTDSFVPASDPSFLISRGDSGSSVSNACLNHPERDGIFVCMNCNRLACRECVKSFGSDVAVCGSCGGMTKSRAVIDLERQRENARVSAIEQGFGMSDFAAAILYPFKFKASLMFGAVMFAFFSLGQGATAFGGIYMIVAAIFSYMLANMLAFGVLANTVEGFAHGKIGKNFMPDFEDFSLWDDVVHPLFLSVGVWISSFGPFAAVFLVATYLVMNSVASQMDTVKSNFEQTPGTPYYNVRDTLDQSNQVRSVLEDSNRINQQHLDEQAAIENGHQPTAIDQTDEKFDHVNKMIADSKRKELESVVGKTPETEERESAAFFAALLNLAAPIMVIGFITFLWGLVYFPAACIVAGYTRSLVAAINPMVGIDTAKRLGAEYVKILLMSAVLIALFLFVNFLLASALSPFNMPGVGNVPARALSSLVYFYLVIVFSCVLGFATFKRSDKLSITN
jgi:hypothetical protein